MADKRSYNSKLNAKGLEQFVSEEQARQMATHQGGRHLLLLEVHAGKKVIDEDGSTVINLVADQVELVPAEQEERVREFMRALYLARPDQYGQQAFEGTASDEPTVDQTAAQLDAVVEVDDNGEPTGIWSGDTDEVPREPVTAEDIEAASGPAWEVCDFPDCELPSEHDGDHSTPVDEPATT